MTAARFAMLLVSGVSAGAAWRRGDKALLALALMAGACFLAAIGIAEGAS